MKTFADSIMRFYRNLRPDFPLPADVKMMNPYVDKYTLKVTTAFYNKYYNDTAARIYLFGINPGRLGGGITGISFTDPIRLQQYCGIEHTFPLKQELSSDFIYRMILSYGGTDLFFSRFFLTAICPLGFTYQGKNLNYYDTPALTSLSEPFIRATLLKQIKAGCKKDIAFCIGEGVNLKYFTRLNDELKLFKQIISLPHPRWVMQYKRPELEKYIHIYIDALRKSTELPGL